MVKISDLRKAVVKGKEDRARYLTKRLLHHGVRVRTILDRGLVAAMEEIGAGFWKRYFVPEALVAARAFNAAMRIVEPFLVAGSAKPLATVVIGTVKGDLHDIGKNLVAMMLRGANFRVEDLGIDVDKSRFVEKIEHLIDIEHVSRIVVGMSALLTTTMPYMENVIKELKAKGLRRRIKIIVGGAPLTQETAKKYGADGYAKDCCEAVLQVRELIGLPTGYVRLRQPTRAEERKGTAPWCASPLSLSDLLGKKDIDGVVQDYASAAGVSADILEMPDEYLWVVAERDWFELIRPVKPKRLLPSNFGNEVIKWHQVTDIVNNSEFCQLVQRSPLGRARCWLCGVANMLACYRARQVREDTCHMGLIELRAPVFIGNYLAAMMSGGQVWAEIPVPDLRRRYEELGPSHIGVSFGEFKKARDESTHSLEKVKVRSAKQLLWQMAKSLSDRATSRATELVTDQISLQTGYRTDMRTGLAFFLLRVEQLLRYSRATVWLRDPYDGSILRIGGAAWDTSLTRLEASTTGLRDIPVGKGLVGWVVEQDEDLLLSTRAEIEAHTKYADIAKFLLGLKSYVAVPIKIGTDTVGAIEMGIDEERAYHATDLRVLHVLAGHVGHYVRASHEFNAFVEMLRASDERLFLKQVVQRLPGLVRGKGCSVFLRAEPGVGPAFLAETTGLVEVSETAPVFYREGEGATGWVLKYQETLNLEAHTNMQERLKATRQFSDCLRFERKYSEDVRSDPNKPATVDEYAQMPFLAVPILDEDGKALGVIRITGRTGGNFSMEDQNAVEACANLIARFHRSQTALLRRKQEEIDALRSVDELTTAGADLRKVLRAVADAVASRPSGAVAAIYILEPGKSLLTLYAGSGPKSKAMVKGLTFDSGVFDQLIQRSVGTETPELVKFASKRSGPPSVLGSALSYVLGSEVVLPLMFEKHPVGLLWASSGEGQTFSNEDRLRIQRFATKAACAIELSHKRKELDIALATSTRQLVQWAKVAHLGTLVAGLAHEIRNPLSTITWTLGELRDGEVPNDIAKQLDIAARHAERIDGIVQGILNFARPDTGELTKIDVSKLIGEVLNLLRNRIDAAAIRVVNSSHRAPNVLGNKGMLQQVFLNVVLNAVQAMAAHGGTLRIIGGRITNKAEIVIQDTGPGIPQEIKEWIFDPFFTTKGPRGGVGLGLSVSYGIVREHGGDIRLVDDPKGGAVFAITLPVYKRRSK